MTETARYALYQKLREVTAFICNKSKNKAPSKFVSSIQQSARKF